MERHFGYIAAVIISGLCFSLYHIGYPGFRTTAALLLLFAVGIGFAAAYKLSGNNLWVAYFVNLPNAVITYMLKSDQFPVFSWSSSVFAVITIALLIVIHIRRRPGRK